MNKIEIEQEFDRQIQTLLNKGYPDAANISLAEFNVHIGPLKEKVLSLELQEIDIEQGKLPFVLVVKSELLPAEKAMRLVTRDTKEGITKLDPHHAQDFEVIESVQIPSQNIYLLVDIDRGKHTLNVRPEDALKIIVSLNRSPLTIDEGIAIITHFPEFLIKNNCFSLLASRHSGNQCVPAIWINANKNPNLGWCWDRNPHTWLGSASCHSRVI
ncbi:MAG: DUF5701 family protein [bacterium]|nr:DUF5701 family protein [bacterium]